MDGWKMKCPLGMAYLYGAMLVSGRVYIYINCIHCEGLNWTKTGPKFEVENLPVLSGLWKEVLYDLYAIRSIQAQLSILVKVNETSIKKRIYNHLNHVRASPSTFFTCNPHIIGYERKQIPSLKLTVRTWKWFSQKERLVFQPSIFRCYIW